MVKLILTLSHELKNEISFFVSPLVDYRRKQKINEKYNFAVINNISQVYNSSSICEIHVFLCFLIYFRLSVIRAREKRCRVEQNG